MFKKPSYILAFSHKNSSAIPTKKIQFMPYFLCNQIMVRLLPAVSGNGEAPDARPHGAAVYSGWLARYPFPDERIV